MKNLNVISLVILELLPFNVQKFKESRDPGPAPLSKKISGVMSGHPGSMHAKFEVCTFNRFEAISI